MSAQKTIIVLMGAPGAGKGTQGKRLAADLGIPTISMGDILRAKKEEDSDLGRELRAIMAEGRYVPDDIVIQMIRERISQPDCSKGFILDGFPRTTAQAEALDRMLEELGLQLTAVLMLDVDEDEVVERLSGRRIAPSSGREYHIRFKPPKTPGVDDETGEPLIQREDDREDTIRKRLEVYRQQTTPVVDYYRARGVLEEIDGSGDFDEIYGRIQEALARAQQH
ncbi:MAG: adenylate kinase [Candidatus Dadabacteria bacterium]|nr:MAG: adenylate kinase [Candidatus Dadabacteria bacterium]